MKTLITNQKFFFLLVVSFFIQNISLGQSPPNLGATSSFALFTAAGAFSNIGTATVVTGDVGTNVGAFSAFPPGTLVGNKHVVDPTSAQAATDVATAYSYLFGLTCDSTIGVTLGSGQVLTPKVYCIGAASTLNGVLTLDGQGDPNALFIFKINGALSTATFSNVNLINSASLCNVYWQINGAFSLGDGSVFRGTILANGQIELLEGSSLFGRGLSTAGAILLHNNKVAISTAAIATVNAGSNQTICANSSVTLSGSVGGSATEGVWSGGTGTFSPNNTTLNAVYTPSAADIASGSVVLTLTTLGGACTQMSDQMTIIINPSPLVNLGHDTTICECIVLNAGYPSASHYWSSGQSYTTINVCVTGTYWVRVNNGTCITFDTIHITVNPPPVVNLGNDTIVTGSLTLNAGNTGASYLWSTSETTQTIIVSTSGQYYVTITDVFGCTVSDTINVTIITGINENAVADLRVNVSPNPSSDNTFTLSFNTTEKTDIEIKVMDVLGKVVYSEKLENFSGSYHKMITLKGMPAGIYFTDVLNGTRRSTTKIVFD